LLLLEHLTEESVAKVEFRDWDWKIGLAAAKCNCFSGGMRKRRLILTGKKQKFLLLTPSETEFLEIIRDFMAKIARIAGFNEDHVNKIQLSVDEACTNIVKHAYKGIQKKDIRIQVELNDEKMIIAVIDKGKGFDPKKIEPLNMNNYLNELRRGGLGIHLMNILMDEIQYSIQPLKKNQVTMIKYFHREESQEKKIRQKILMERSYARKK